MKILMSSNGRNSDETSISGKYYNNSNDICFQSIKGFDAVKVNVVKSSQLLITLVVPDTWCNNAGDGAWFGIKVGGKVVTRGLYTVATAGQRVPITLQAAIDVDEDKNIEIQPVWCNTNDAQGACYIGSYSESTLTVLVSELNMDLAQLQDMVSKITSVLDLKGMPR